MIFHVFRCNLRLTLSYIDTDSLVIVMHKITSIAFTAGTYHANISVLQLTFIEFNVVDISNDVKCECWQPSMDVHYS